MKLAFARLAPGALRARGRAARRGRPALRRLDDAPARAGRLHRAGRRATATCARRATPSRAAPPRSCATSSPSGSSGCRPSRAPTRTSPGRTCPDERPTMTCSYTDVEDALREPPCATCSPTAARPAAVLAAGRRPRPTACRTTARCGRRSPADLGPGRAAGARGARRGRRLGARGRRGAGGARPRGRAGAVPHQRGGRHHRAAGRRRRTPACSAGSRPGSRPRRSRCSLAASADAAAEPAAVLGADGTGLGHGAGVAGARGADVLLVPVARRRPALYAVDAAAPG